jgi:hypothetical protein
MGKQLVHVNYLMSSLLQKLDSINFLLLPFCLMDMYIIYVNMIFCILSIDHFKQIFNC